MSNNSRDEFDHYRKLLGEDELSLLLHGLAKFDAEFQTAVRRGSRFTIRLEVHGNKGQLINCRCVPDITEMPGGRKSRNP